MEFELNQEQQQLRATVRSFCDREIPTERVRAAEPGGFDADLWKQLSALGLPKLTIPLERGGQGAGMIEAAVTAAELGRALAPVPFVESTVALRVLAAIDLGTVPDGASALISDALAGERLVTIAVHPLRESCLELLPAGAVSDAVIAERGDEIVLVEREWAKVVAAQNVGSLPLASWTLEREPLVIVSGSVARAQASAGRSGWKLLTAAALLGLSERALEIGTEYVKERKAFGITLSRFQTITHRLADIAASLDGLRLLVDEAAWAADEGLDDAPSLATMSLAFASEAAIRASGDSLHFHGGYGYTLEQDIQLYYRRAKAWPLMYGDPRRLYQELATQLYGPTNRHRLSDSGNRPYGTQSHEEVA